MICFVIAKINYSQNLFLKSIMIRDTFRKSVQRFTRNSRRKISILLHPHDKGELEKGLVMLHHYHRPFLLHTKRHMHSFLHQSPAPEPLSPHLHVSIYDNATLALHHVRLQHIERSQLFVSIDITSCQSPV